VAEAVKLRTYTRDEVRARLQLRCVLTDDFPLPPGSICGHRDEELAITIVEVGEIFACIRCGAWWYAKTSEGVYRRPPHCCCACGVNTQLGRYLCVECWQRLPTALQGRLRTELIGAKGWRARLQLPALREAVATAQAARLRAP
jgi:hypothetical protein